MSRNTTQWRRALRFLPVLALLSGCENAEAEREALELELSVADAGVFDAQLAINRYDGTAEIEELVAEAEADERAVTAGDLPPAEFEQRAVARQARLDGLLAAQENLDRSQDTTWLRLAATLDSARTAQREAREALEAFLTDPQ